MITILRAFTRFVLADWRVAPYDGGMNKILRMHGGKPLTGSIKVAGAKNAATKMMIASLLTDEPVVLYNCPQIEDVQITAALCEGVGASVTREENRYTLHTPTRLYPDAPFSIAFKERFTCKDPKSRFYHVIIIWS